MSEPSLRQRAAMIITLVIASWAIIIGLGLAIEWALS